MLVQRGSTVGAKKVTSKNVTSNQKSSECSCPQLLNRGEIHGRLPNEISRDVKFPGPLLTETCAENPYVGCQFGGGGAK